MTNATHKSLSKKQVTLIVLGAMLTLLLAALDNTIVSTAMPMIIRDLNGMEHYAWPFTSYMLFSTIVLPISGKLADIYGRKRITLIGIALFALASVLCGFSRGMIELSIFRGFQGIGGGICVSSAFIIVSEIFPLGKRAKYIGLITSMFALASIMGPGLGGVITDKLSWRWVFFVNIPLCAAAFFLIAKNFPVIIHQDNAKRRLDIPGTAAFVLAAFPLLLAISRLGSESITSIDMVSLFLFSGIMIAVFLFLELRSKEPLLSLHFFRDRIFSVSVIASSLGNMAIFGAAIYFPLYLQSLRGQSATRSGLIMMPMMVSMIISSNIAGVLLSKLHRFKIIAAVGLALATAGTFCFGYFGEHSQISTLMIFSTMSGFGLGLTFPIFAVAPQSVFHPRQIGIVTSLLQFFRNLGGSIGSAVFGAIMLSHMHKVMKGVPHGSLSEQTASLIQNPGVIANPAKVSAIRGSIPDSSLDDFNRFVSSCLHSMSGSIEMIFIVSSAILLFALATLLYYFNERHVAQAVAEHKKQY